MPVQLRLLLKHQRARQMIGGLFFLSTGREKVLSLGSTKKGSIQRNMIVCNSWLGIVNKQSNYHGRRITKFVRCVFQVFFFSPKKFKIFIQFWFVPAILFLSDLNEFLMPICLSVLVFLLNNNKSFLQMTTMCFIN